MVTIVTQLLHCINLQMCMHVWLCRIIGENGKRDWKQLL